MANNIKTIVKNLYLLHESFWYLFIFLFIAFLFSLIIRNFHLLKAFRHICTLGFINLKFLSLMLSTFLGKIRGFFILGSSYTINVFRGNMEISLISNRTYFTLITNEQNSALNRIIKARHHFINLYFCISVILIPLISTKKVNILNRCYV